MYISELFISAYQGHFKPNCSFRTINVIHMIPKHAKSAPHDFYQAYSSHEFHNAQSKLHTTTESVFCNLDANDEELSVLGTIFAKLVCLRTACGAGWIVEYVIVCFRAVRCLCFEADEWGSELRSFLAFPVEEFLIVKIFGCFISKMKCGNISLSCFGVLKIGS